MNLARLKPGDSVATDWRTINVALGALEAMDRRINRLEHPNDRRFQSSPLEPFEIYQTSTWLKYKVATGYYITTSTEIIPTDVETEFTLSSGVARYWFYLDVTDTTATVLTSSGPVVWAVDKIPIGWVDTATGSATSSAMIYQFLRDHVFNPCIPPP